MKILVKVALFAMLFASPAMAQPSGCIIDAELDAAVGDQIRAGDFAINTSKLREAPMCSGLTVAQAIQQIGNRPRGETPTEMYGAVEASAPPLAAAPPPTPAALAAPKRSYPFSVSFKDPTAAQDRIARTALSAMFREYAEYANGHGVSYSVGMVDLNDDGRDDMIVHVRDQQTCGMWGCQGYGVLATPSGFANRGVQLGVCFNYALSVLPTKTGGMRDLSFDDHKQKTVWTGRYYDGGCVDP